MASKLRKSVSFDAILFFYVHRRRKTSVLVHMGWQRKNQKRLFSMPFSILKCFAFVKKGATRAVAGGCYVETPSRHAASDMSCS